MNSLINHSKKNIYLDYNATTPMSPSVLDCIQQSLTNAWGNPSSSYKEGINARNTIEEARKHVADMVNASSRDIIFTSGGSESNNWVIDCALKAFKSRNCGKSALKPHIITSTVEHDSILVPLRYLKAEGLIELTLVPVSKMSGIIEAEDVACAVQSNTCLISIMMANNETGVIMPIKEIMAAVRKKEEAFSISLMLHTDAAQTIGKIPIDVAGLNVDFLTIVGHKFYGPRIGALYIKDLNNRNPQLQPFIYGGGQERGWRSGTENTPMIAGLGRAAKDVKDNIDDYQSSMLDVTGYLERCLLDEFGKDKLTINCKASPRLPNTCNVSFLDKGLEGYKILQKATGFHCSTGAACHSGNCEPSKILLLFHIPHGVAANALRFSTGRDTTKQEVDDVIQELRSIVNSLTNS